MLLILEQMEKVHAKIITTATDDFHLYRLDWAPYGIRGYFDNEKVFEYHKSNTRVMHHGLMIKNFICLLNIAVGGNWGGAQGVDDTDLSCHNGNRLCQVLSLYKVILLRIFSR